MPNFIHQSGGTLEVHQWLGNQLQAIGDGPLHGFVFSDDQAENFESMAAEHGYIKNQGGWDASDCRTA